MKKVVIFLLLFLAAVAGTTAQQQYLVARNSITQKAICLREGKHLRVRTLDNRMLHGRLGILNDSTILIGENLVQLNEIAFVKYRPGTTQAAGYSISGISALTIGLAGNMMKQPAPGGEWGQFFTDTFALFLMSFGLAGTVPAAVLIFVHRELSVSHWEFTVLRN